MKNLVLSFVVLASISTNAFALEPMSWATPIQETPDGMIIMVKQELPTAYYNRSEEMFVPNFAIEIETGVPRSSSTGPLKVGDIIIVRNPEYISRNDYSWISAEAQMSTFPYSTTTGSIRIYTKKTNRPYHVDLWSFDDLRNYSQGVFEFYKPN